MEVPARRFLDFIGEICYNSITTLFPPSESVLRIQGAQPIDMEINSSVDSVPQDACTPKFQSENGTDKWPLVKDQSELFQETGRSKQLFARSVVKMENLESSPHFFGETQAIKQQRLGGGRTRQVYVRQKASTCTSVAEMVKRFESRTGEVYVQKTITPPVSATPAVSVTDIVKQFEYKTKEGWELDSIVRHEKEFERENMQILEQGEAQKLIIKEQPIMRHGLLPYHGKARKPLMDVLESAQDVEALALDVFELDSKFMKEKENVYKRFREEENECAKADEERGELKRLRKTWVLNTKPLPKFSKEITLSNLLTKQRNVKKMSGSSPATNMS